MANYQIPSPEKSSFKPEDWEKWISRFERFRKATGKGQRTRENQVNTLVYSTGDFIMELYVLAEHCQFGALKEELIRDRIVVGLRKKRLSEKVQPDPNLTLEKAINLVRQSESVKKQQSVLHSTKKSDAAKVYRIAKGKFDISKKRSDN